MSKANNDEKAKRMSRAERKKERARLEAQGRSFSDHPLLADIKPREKYVFHSDYFEVDGRFATIMSFFHMEGAQDTFVTFWGVHLIPRGLKDGVQTVIFEQNRRMTEAWISTHQSRTEGVDDNSQADSENNGSTMQMNMKQSVRRQDIINLSRELQSGAAYMHIHFRMLVSAPTLDDLDEAVEKISRQYVDAFASVNAAAYPGEQRKELSTLFGLNSRKLGNGFYMTSEEYAGSYSLVTHGIEDSTGEYVGYMTGDVNNAAVLFDIDNYGHHVVIADESYCMGRDRQHSTALWGSKLAQACMLNNGRVVHLILDGTNIDLMGPAFENLTFRLDLNAGDVNMFEIFGQRKDQLSLFPAQMQKLILMAEQAYETTDSDRSIIRGSLEEVATKYYIDQKMWYENAGENVERLRIVGIPHDEVPKLEMFCAYLDMEYQALVNKTARDEDSLKAMKVLALTFRNLLSNNGDLFNTTTSDAVDGVSTGKRVIYDFSSLMMRGQGVAMAQLVNIMGFAVNSLGKGDLVVVHGADKIDDGVKKYLDQQFTRLYDAGGRVAYIYNNVSRMLKDKDFNTFDKADYMILGTMPVTSMQEYEKLLGQRVPADLARLVTSKAEGINYIRRGYDNIVFKRELSLGIGRKV